MKSVFADTSFFIAVASKRDQFHKQAIGIAAAREGSILTTDFVLIELGNHFSRVGDRASFEALLPELRNETDILIPATRELVERGINLYLQRSDKPWSLTDCTSFIAMEQAGIVDALTTDHHFEQAGFNVLLR
jgi:predicted nucleic acid-binding protein